MGQGRAVMLLYGLLNNRVEIHARALDLWSTAISKPGLTTVIPGGGEIVVEHGQRHAVLIVSLTISFPRESDFSRSFRIYRTIEG